MKVCSCHRRPRHCPGCTMMRAPFVRIVDDCPVLSSRQSGRNGKFRNHFRSWIRQKCSNSLRRTRIRSSCRLFVPKSRHFTRESDGAGVSTFHFTDKPSVESDSDAKQSSPLDVVKSLVLLKKMSEPEKWPNETNKKLTIELKNARMLSSNYHVAVAYSNGAHLQSDDNIVRPLLGSLCRHHR